MRVVMATKNIQIVLSAIVLLWSGLLCCVAPAEGAPVALNDRAMDEVTAGNGTEGGGVIVGNSSVAVIKRADSLNLNDEAQQATQGLNVVNSAQTAVANTVNVWDGNSIVASGASEFQTEIEFNQANQVTQEQLSSATLSGYVRSEADQADISNKSGSDDFVNKIVNVNSQTNQFEETRIATTVSSSEVDTGIKFNVGDSLYFEGNLGQGIAVAGNSETVIDGGSADIALVLGGGISVDAGIGIGDEDLIEPVFGTNLGETEASASINGSGSISLISQFELPKMEIDIDGTGCAVVMGSCSSSSVSNEFVSTKTDNSSLNIVENHQSGQSSYSDIQTSIYRSAFELENASAEYIVIDNSALELSSDVELELSDSAQKDIKGMDIVNAIGSNVANTTNISRTTGFDGYGSKLVLNQFNAVHHGQ